MTDQRSTATLEYVRVQITETQGASIDATGVELAFATGGGVPSVSDWRPGAWETDPGPTRTAKVLVGPGALQLAAGVYTVWYRFQDDTERPARPAGQLTVVA